MNKIKKYFFILILLELFFSYAPAYAQSAAAANYSKSGVSDQIAKYLCVPNPVPASQTNYTNGAFQGQDAYQLSAAANNSNSGVLFQCINQIYKFAIVLASVVGMFFIVIAGYVYMSADGNKESVDKAKSILTSTITALVILLGGYVLLKAINPDLIQFQSIQPPSVTLDQNSAFNNNIGLTPTTPTTPSVPGTPNTNTSCSQNFSNPPATGCTSVSNCVNVSNLTSSHDCTSNNGLCLLSTTAAQKAQGLISAFNAANTGCQLKISAAIEGGTGPSSSTCHFLGNSNAGTCADFNVIGYNTTCAQAFYTAAQNAGVVSFLDEYASSCKAPTTTGGNIHVNF